MNISIAGGSGFLGREFTRILLDFGHTVTVLGQTRPATDRLDSRAVWNQADVLADGLAT